MGLVSTIEPNIIKELDRFADLSLGEYDLKCRMYVVFFAFSLLTNCKTFSESSPESAKYPSTKNPLIGRDLTGHASENDNPMNWNYVQHIDNIAEFVGKYLKQQSTLNQFHVCDPDSRNEVRSVSRASEFKDKFVAHLAITFERGGLGICTGFFIEPRKLATASHCLYSHEPNGGYANKVIVRPGLSRDAEGRTVVPFGGAFGNHFVTHLKWVSDKDFNFDYGLVIFRTDELFSKIGSEVPFRLFIASREQLGKGKWDATGYPDDLNPDQRLLRLFRSGAEEMDPIRSTDSIIYGSVDTFNGMSGEPLADGGPDGWLVIGITSHQFDANKCLNGFTRVNEDSRAAMYDYWW